MIEEHIRVTQVIVPIEHDLAHVREKACRIAGIQPDAVTGFTVTRKSLDARKKGALRYSYTVELSTERAPTFLRRDARVRKVHPVIYQPRASGTEPLAAPIAVIGSGPAGLFCALLLAQHGFTPCVYERGKTVKERTVDVTRFWSGGALNPNSNVQFGEGGAGTFSDGKLNTAVRDKAGRDRFVLETFVRFGAPEEIVYEALPHIGSDALARIVANMREEILRLGGKFFYSTVVCGLETETDGQDADTQRRRLTALRIRPAKTPEKNAHPQGGGSTRETPPVPVGTADQTTRVPAEAAVLAIGHSARDTFAMLREADVPMEAKPFAVGLRVEHPQEAVNRAQYGEDAARCHPEDAGKEDAPRGCLPPAVYKLTHRAANGRSVYSFCMCPGGYVVNASSEAGHTTVNGMSNRLRDSHNANSAIVVSVTPEDFPDADDPLSGVAFQRQLEERAYRAGDGKIPQQRFGAFAREDAEETAADGAMSEAAARSGSLKEDVAQPFPSCRKGAAVPADIRAVLPAAVRDALVEGMHAFSRKIEGFDRADAILSAVESRTSSPVRILRNEQYESEIAGLYPCGEGAGYAGGILSAAMDGLKVAEALLARYRPARDDKKDAPGAQQTDDGADGAGTRE